MKIKKLAVAAVSFLHLKGPDDAFLYENDKPVGIDLYGPGTTQAALVEERQTTRALARMSENDGKPSLPPIERHRAEVAEDLAMLTHGFREIEYDDLTGEKLHVAVYADPELGWIKEQALKHVGKWGKFLPNSATS